MQVRRCAVSESVGDDKVIAQISEGRQRAIADKRLGASIGKKKGFGVSL